MTTGQRSDLRTGIAVAFLALSRATRRLVVSSSCVWQLTEGIEARLRKAGVANIMMFSPYEGMIDLSAPTHCGPLLARLGDLVGRGADVLLVEDDEDYAAVVEFELGQSGYRVARASNGVEALAAIERNAPKAMVLDLPADEATKRAWGQR